jgi:hypothetical protein
MQGFNVLFEAFVINVEISTQSTYLYLSEDRDSTSHHSVESLYLVTCLDRSLKEQGEDHVINGAKNVLDFTVLQICVWAGYPQDHPIGCKECSRGSIIELMTIITLDDFDGAAKLCGGISKKIDKLRKVSDLTHKGKVHTKWERSSRINRYSLHPKIFVAFDFFTNFDHSSY